MTNDEKLIIIALADYAAAVVEDGTQRAVAHADVDEIASEIIEYADEDTFNAVIDDYETFKLLRRCTDAYQRQLRICVV